MNSIAKTWKMTSRKSRGSIIAMHRARNWEDMLLMGVRSIYGEKAALRTHTEGPIDIYDIVKDGRTVETVQIMIEEVG